MGLFDVMGFLEPKPFFHETFDEVGVVAFPNVIFEEFLVFVDIQISVDVVGEVDHK
jgi:hypothetical protein